MSERPFITVGGLIVASDGTVLLVRSKKWGDRYSTPGGKIEWGETGEEAFLREVWEETGLKVVNLRFVQKQDSVFSDEFWKKCHFVMHDYIAYLDPACAKEQVQLNDEAYAYCWIDPKEALKLPLQQECKNLITWYCANILGTPSFGILGIEGLQIPCIIGIYPDERVKEQLVIIDVKVQFDLSRFFATSQFSDTFDYDKLAILCRTLGIEKKYLLLETFACEILEHCFRFPGVHWAFVRIKKPSAIPSAACAFVEFERGMKG